MFIDSHCHIDLIKSNNYGLLIKDFINNNVRRILCVSINLLSFEKLLLICKKYKNIDISIGIHPNEVLNIDNINNIIDKLYFYSKYKNVIAIGETGLDFYRNYNFNMQKKIFIQHINISKILKKPLIIHSRNSFKYVINILNNEKNNSLKGVLHSFNGDWKVAKKFIDMNFFISFSGILTFKNNDELIGVIKNIPLEKLIIETDSPYLSPIPFRGKINNSSKIKYIYNIISRIKKIDILELMLQVSRNYFNLFF